MKRLAVITTSLLLAATAFGGTTAYADESGTIYPENGDFIKTLTFSDLKDYEIEGDAYYFLDGETNYKYENGKLTNEAPENGFSESKTTVDIEGGYTFRLTDSTLKVWDNEDKITTFEGEYSLLKPFGDVAYAVKNNTLYRFNNADEPEKVISAYADYSITNDIPVGHAANDLKEQSSLTFVTIKAGAYMTHINLDILEGTYFTLKDTDAQTVADNTLTLTENTAALLLCYTGNAAIVSIGNDSYVLNKSNVQKNEQINCYKQAEFPNATITGNRIYSSPYVIKSTSPLCNSPIPDATGMIVTVKNKLVCEGELEGLLNSVYYEVEYGSEDNRKTGYVADGLLTAFIIEDNKEPSVIPDPEHSESNNSTTVFLVLAVVVLVLAAIGYLIYVSTSDKQKKKGKKAEEEKSEEK